MARESSWDQLIEEVKGERVIVAEDMLGFAVRPSLSLGIGITSLQGNKLRASEL